MDNDATKHYGSKDATIVSICVCVCRVLTSHARVYDCVLHRFV